MTFEQLNVFVAVAERGHLTKASESLGLTPSAVSSAIKALENSYNIRLFDRVGRNIELNAAGRIFLTEAKAILARVSAGALTLTELGGLHRGVLNIQASQTVASYWLPPRLMRFHQNYPGIEIRLTVGNTKTVSDAVALGLAELGFIEGLMDNPLLASSPVAQDELVVVCAPDHPLTRTGNEDLRSLLIETTWVMRELGSGTRSEFEARLKALSCDIRQLKIALTLPSNEAVLSAIEGSNAAAAVSRRAAEPLVRAGILAIADVNLPSRSFKLLRHKERSVTIVARKFEQLL